MTLSRKFCLLVMITTSTAALEVMAQSAARILDRSAAMASAQSIDTESIVSQLSSPASLGDGNDTVARLKALSQRQDWPLTARELAIYQFTRSLSTVSRHTVDPAIMDFLTTYQARVLVSGEEHKREQLPLFNIRAAAIGVQNRWLRIDSVQLASDVILANPDAFLMLYSNAKAPAAKAGFLDALRRADNIDIQSIGTMALQQLPDNPELTDVVAVAAESDPHGHTVLGLLLDGRGAQMAPGFRQLGRQVGTASLADLLVIAIEKAPAENASLAIASWWPKLSGDAATRKILLHTLADPELGSAAALALAEQPDIQTIHELQQLAQGDSLAAKRARMSLEISRHDLLQEQQQ